MCKEPDAKSTNMFEMERDGGRGEERVKWNLCTHHQGLVTALIRIR